MTTPKRASDVNQLAKLVLDIATGKVPKQVSNEPAPQLLAGVAQAGRAGRPGRTSLGRESAEIARKAAKAHWGA